jgi:penicillin-binding protein 1C
MIRRGWKGGWLALGFLVLPILVLLGLGWSRSGLETPQPTVLLRDRHGRFLAEVRGVAEIPGSDANAEAGYWPMAALPLRVAAATLAVEDRRFYRHPGVDPLAIARAAIQNLSHGRRLSGASTVAMQVARMQRPGPRSLGRKLVEGTTALLLTARHGREQVLAHYMRLAPYGNSIHGIAYAARRYLDKPVEDLSWAETAFLTAIPQAPGRMNPFRPEGKAAAVARGQRILQLLRDRGALDEAQHELAQRQILNLTIPEPGQRPIEALHLVLRLEKELLDPRARAALGDRAILDLSIDLELQGRLTALAAKHLRNWESRGAGNVALMVLDPQTREVLASIGSTGYFDDRHAGAIDYTRVLRSPGSLLKPFFYADALDRGLITPSTILDDIQRGAGGITNADERFLGPLLPRVALANSRNVPAVSLLARLGLNEGISMLEDLGLVDDPEVARLSGLGLAVGGTPVTLEQIVRAYATISAGGRCGSLRWLCYRGEREERSDLYKSEARFSEATARQITLFLSDPLARLPSFPRMGSTEYPFPVAVKTGTSTNFRDAWAVAFSRRYLVGAWVGHPASRPMDHLSGAVSAAGLVQDVMLRLHPVEAAGLEDLAFPPPAGYLARRVCALTGSLATPDCNQVFVEWFPPGGEPMDACAAHRSVTVDARNGRPVGRDTPMECVEVRHVVDVAPRYAAWATRAGLPSSLSARTAPAHPTGSPSGTESGVQVRVTQPENGTRLLHDPETPADLATIGLEVVVDPPTSEVVWYVDGAPYQVAGYPYSARWSIQPGEHVIEARLAHTRVGSNRVRIWVE